jgi:hypothetical protein
VFTSSCRAHDSALLQFQGHEPVSWLDPDAFGRGVAEGTLRRDWTWLAFVDDRAVARAVWWGPVGSVHPVALRCLIVDASLPHPEVWGAALIRSAHRAFADAGALLVPDLVVETDALQSDPDRLDAALAWRRRAAADAGLAIESVATPAEAGGTLTRHTFSARPLTVSHPRSLAGAGR